MGVDIYSYLETVSGTNPVTDGHKLGPGHVTHDYMVDIIVDIASPFGTETTYIFQIQVRFRQGDAQMSL